MNRYLLDTNIVSNLIKPTPSPQLLVWMEDQFDESLYISSLTVAEIRFGILRLPDGRKRRDLETWFLGTSGPQAMFAARILPFDEKAALIWAIMMADGRNQGRPRSSVDMFIAAIAAANDCIVVTDNERDFLDLKILNPMKPSP